MNSLEKSQIPLSAKANNACFQMLRLSSNSGYSRKDDTQYHEAKRLGASTYQGVIIQIHLPSERPPCCSNRKLLPALNLALPVFLDHLQLSCKQRKQAVLRVLSLVPWQQPPLPLCRLSTHNVLRTHIMRINYACLKNNWSCHPAKEKQTFFPYNYIQIWFRKSRSFLASFHTRWSLKAFLFRRVLS